MSSAKFPAAVFKAYDIRGTVPEQLNARFAFRLGLALAHQAQQQGVQQMVIGYDGRHSSPELAEALQQGLNQGGIEAFDLGLVPTPVVYFAAHHLRTGSGVAITGSHNPSNYNGFKMMLGGKTLHGADIEALHQLMEGDLPTASIPAIRSARDLKEDYLQAVTDRVKLERPLRVAIDCGNGATGVLAESLFRRLGCEVVMLYDTVDGNFPHHHPDPAVPDNLADLIAAVRTHQCDLGLAFDGDGDRLGVVTPQAEIIWPDRQLILFAQDILTRLPGSTIIYDVKCSRHVGLAVKAAGGVPLMWQTGHSLIKAKLAETGAPLAGEMSGHIFFAERWFGFDDGLYTGARLLEILSRHPEPAAILSALPKDRSTPELKIDMQEGEPHAFVQELKKADFPSAQQRVLIDGIRAEYADGFGLARASNTTPVVVLRFEADNDNALQRIKDEFRQAILSLRPDLKLPF